jgi:DNA-binding CsgD family transcriptional regulator
MLHITHFALIVAFAVGLAAITVSAQIYRRHRLGYIRAHLAIVISFNLMIFISLVALYIFTLPAGDVPRAALRTVDVLFQFLVPLLQLLAAYFFIHIIRGMLERQVGARIRSVAWAIVGGYAAVQAVALATSMTIGGARLSQTVIRIVWVLSLGTIYAVLIATIPQIGRIDAPGKRRALGAYCYLLLGLITFVIALAVLNRAGVMTIPSHNLVSALVIIAMNAIPVLYIRWFVERFHGAPAVAVGAVADRATLFERYDISPREREIVELICEGKTNGEIADALFISLQTVKGHVFRVFRKTGVRNRVQLVNLFMQSDGENGR